MSTQETQGAVAVPVPGKPGLAAGEPSLGRLVGYFLRLGTVGFGGPVALVGSMQRDLVERRGWVDDQEYKLALAQIMPGPPTAAIALASLAVLWRFKVPEPLLVLAGGLVCLALWQVGR